MPMNTRNRNKFLLMSRGRGQHQSVVLEALKLCQKNKNKKPPSLVTGIYNRQKKTCQNAYLTLTKPVHYLFLFSSEKWCCNSFDSKGINRLFALEVAFTQSNFHFSTSPSSNIVRRLYRHLRHVLDRLLQTTCISPT